MIDNYEFVAKENDESQNFDYDEVTNSVFGGDDYDYEIKKVSKKVKKKIKKYLKKQTAKPKKNKKMAKEISKLKSDLKKIKKDQLRNKIDELINCDSAVQRKQLAKELWEEVRLA